ncbi:Aste57867_12495 [Aphanomyces stellatus]|uniref:RBR-type E3 ubiquitin transferase n=1 Tax=Aphanomyces stellatus TaxID=120398 RepID=A0A485KVQ6_9STRA|nr:hypothetical protein As57867_012449 [Aphanomyces stellatus]VFT89346.1 Aste57867_12495 [Aphanomyces stellatus]
MEELAASVALVVLFMVAATTAAATMLRRTKSSSQVPCRAVVPPSVSGPICMICLDIADVTESVCCGACPDVCCAACFETYLVHEVGKGRATILCPGGCATLVPTSVLQRNMTPALFDKFQTFLEAPTGFLCPACCLPCQLQFPSTRKMRCKACRRNWCGECGKAYHWISCRDHLFQRYRARHRIRPCPHCRRDIEKSEGCDHMTCAKCAFEFCWRCGDKWAPRHRCRLLRTWLQLA